MYFGGAFGDRASNDNSRFRYEKGSGAHENYLNRIIDAIIGKILDRYCNWPDNNERIEISHRIFQNQKHGWPNCLGFADGTLFPLFFKLRRTDCGDYVGRKLGHTLSALFVCDHNLHIRCFNAGWPGSTHDDKVLRNSDIFKNKEQYFTFIECLLGDSVFTNNNFFILST